MTVSPTSPEGKTAGAESDHPRLLGAGLAVLSTAAFYAVSVFVAGRIGTALAKEDVGQVALIKLQLTLVAGAMLTDVLVGVLPLAAGVIFSARAFGRPLPSLGRVAVRLWLPYAVLRILQMLGLILIIPGAVLSVAVAFFLDPVRFGEGRPHPFAVPSVRSTIAIAVLFGVWAALWTPWNIYSAYLTDRGPVPVIGAQFVWEILTAGAWFAWCAAWRLGRAVP